jgi:hypothetical protein
MATSVSGLGLANFEFLLYAIIGFLLATALYVYASKAYKKSGFLAVVAFFVVMSYFLNYQCVPFSLAFGFLFLLFMLETRQKSFNVILTMIVLFTIISFTHAFAALFFVLYLLIRCILNRSKQYGRLFLLTLVIYLVINITQAPFSFTENIRGMLVLPAEYSSIVEATLVPVSVPVDIIARMFSRGVTITTAMICFVGFTVLLIRRKAGNLDKAIFLTGTVYSAFGIMLYTLGSRAIPIVFIPISLGAPFLLESRLRPYMQSIFLVLLILFAFIPLHTSFIDSPLMFQTREAYVMANFMIKKYNWNAYGTILWHVGAGPYVFTQVEGNYTFETDYSPYFTESNIENYDCIIYSISLAKNLLENNVSEKQILDRFNVIYHSHSSYIAKKSK